MGEPRRRAMTAFLVTAGWGDVSATPLAVDASFRRYYRLVRAGSSAVLMDAPPPQEDIGPYVVVAALLRELGFSAPAVLAEDRDEGFLLLEDFGDDTYTRLLERGADEPALYTLAVDTLIALQRAAELRGTPEIPPYDIERLLGGPLQRDQGVDRKRIEGRLVGAALEQPCVGVVAKIFE